MADYWAFCDPCARWFYPDSDAELRVPACPVCSTEAVTLAETPPESPEDAAKA